MTEKARAFMDALTELTEQYSVKSIYATTDGTVLILFKDTAAGQIEFWSLDDDSLREKG